MQNTTDSKKKVVILGLGDTNFTRLDEYLKSFKEVAISDKTEKFRFIIVGSHFHWVAALTEYKLQEPFSYTVVKTHEELIESVNQPLNDFIFFDVHNLIKEGDSGIEIDKEVWKINYVEFGTFLKLYLHELGKVVKNLSTQIHCVLAMPVNENFCRLGGFTFRSQIDYFQEITNSENILNIYYSKNFIIATMTDEIGFAKVLPNITGELIKQKIILFAEALKKYFKFEKPSIALGQINPLMSDYGLLGSEESEIVVPTLQKFTEEVFQTATFTFHGPMNSYDIFSEWGRSEYNGILCYYYEQAINPIVALDGLHVLKIVEGLGFNFMTLMNKPDFSYDAQRKPNAKLLTMAFNKIFEL